MNRSTTLFLSIPATQIGLLLCLLLITAIIYYPALHSPFALDDFYNLGNLGEVGSKGYAYYVFGSGFSGPLGRPLSLLTFALQHQYWPHDPFAFKLFNLLIHLFNGVLIFLLCRLLARCLEFNNRHNLIFSLLVTAIWLLHPMQLSTVLYTVQRMTLISAFFTLLGAVGYLYVREHVTKLKDYGTLTLLSSIVMIATTLALLGKENGILLLLFILVFEATLLSDAHKPKLWRLWAWIFLVCPLLLLSFYLALHLGDTLSGYQYQPFTLYQRLLTEAVILLTYIKDLLIPHPGAFTLFHDDFPISTGLMSPPITLGAITGIVGLLFMAVVLRKHQSVISFAILWFFGGHILESTYLNLELYFEHRNYLPSFGIFFLIAWLIYQGWQYFSRKLIVTTIAMLYFVLILSVTIMEINLWADPELQAIEWARNHPKSKRALENLSLRYLLNEEYVKAIEINDRIKEQDPDDIYPEIKKIDISYCLLNKELTQTEWEEIINKSGQTKWRGHSIIAALDQFILKVVSKRCRITNHSGFKKLIRTLILNHEYELVRGALHEHAASFAVFEKNYEVALFNIRAAVKLSPTPARTIYLFRVLMNMGKKTEASAVLNKFKQQLDIDPRLNLAYDDTILELEEQLK